MDVTITRARYSIVMRSPAPLVACLVACAACKAPAVSFTLTESQDVTDEVERLTEMFELRDVEVRQRDTTVEVFTRDGSVPPSALQTRRALDRIIAAPNVPPEPRVVLHMDGEDHPLAFVPASGRLALDLLEQPFGTFRTCTYEVPLESPVADVSVALVPPSTHDASAARPDYSMVTPGATREPELRLAGEAYACGTQGLDLEGGTARFVFGITNVSRSEADVNLMFGGSYDECAELVLHHASPDFIARAMFPRLAGLATTGG